MKAHKFAIAMSCYSVLAIVALFTLDGSIRLVLWIFLAGLAVKTVIARAAGW